MQNLELRTWVVLSVAGLVLGCETSKKGLGNGEPDSGLGQGGSGAGAGGLQATGGSRATGGTVGRGGAVGQGGTSVPGQGGSGGATSAGGALGTGGSAPGSGGRSGSGGTTASTGGTIGGDTGGASATGGIIAGTGGVLSTGGVGAGSGGNAGTSTGGSSGSASGGAGGRGTGGTTTSTGGNRAGGATGTGGVVATGGTSSGLGGFGGHKTCQADSDCPGFKCCGSLCSNTNNDILNCGACGQICTGPNPYCNNGTCGTPLCQGNTCGSDTSCCGSQCCGAGKLCCMVTIGPSLLGCFDPVDGTCPTGCAACVCAAPTTPIATPLGERPIADLKVGDWVYSVDHGQIRPVPIKRINRQAVPPTHTMVQVRLATGRVLTISPGHPTADGRTFRALAIGQRLDGVAIIEALTVAYDQPFTHDILPDSDSGTYFAAGVRIGSTLAAPLPEPLASTAESGTDETFARGTPVPLIR